MLPSVLSPSQSCYILVPHSKSIQGLYGYGYFEYIQDGKQYLAWFCATPASQSKLDEVQRRTIRIIDLSKNYLYLASNPATRHPQSSRYYDHVPSYEEAQDFYANCFLGTYIWIPASDAPYP